MTPDQMKLQRDQDLPMHLMTDMTLGLFWIYSRCFHWTYLRKLAKVNLRWDTEYICCFPLWPGLMPAAGATIGMEVANQHRVHHPRHVRLVNLMNEMLLP
jgi:hypothetical protein